MRKVGRWIMVVILIMIFLISGRVPAQAAIINVPGDHVTIQAAINAAVTGDEIIVAAAGGPYVENIVFIGNKDITVKTTDGATIDGNDSGSVVSFTGGDTSTLGGFTINNGSGTDRGDGITLGAGMYCLSSSPRISDCIIINNDSTGDGGGTAILPRFRLLTAPSKKIKQVPAAESLVGNPLQRLKIV